MAIPAIQSLDVDSNTLRVKFQRTLKYESIVDSAFTLTKVGDPSTLVAGPFDPIELAKDYNTVSRVLSLRLAVSLDPTATYNLNASGLIDAAGLVVVDDSVEFEGSLAVGDHLPDVPPTPEFTVEDYSVLPTAFTESDTISEPIVDPEKFHVLSSDPADDEYHVAESYNNGIVTLKFSHFIGGEYLTDEYFGVQRRKIQRGPTRWEALNANITADAYKPWVYVAFPSVDIEPVYSLSGHTYFEKGYKYRVKVLKAVQSGTTDVVVDGEAGGVVDGGDP